jgi:cyclopropane fatty-acyl-phospholipid synthase-like methyltransferase
MINIILIVIIIQLFITQFYTNTKEFSGRALIRNLSIALSIYFYNKLNNIYYLFIPIILEIIIESLKLNGYHMEKYIATKYQYNDYWREINKNNSIFSNFSEGNYNKILGFDTTDTSQENIKRILDWSRHTYKYSIETKPSYLIDYNGNKHNSLELKKKSEYDKFKLISNICKVKKGMKILEIGFGEGDFMMFLRNEYGIETVGVSISCEQVKLVQSRGFTAYCLNAWDITPEKVGTFDLIIQCGNLEYICCSGEDYEIYTKYSNIIKKMLNSNGKYFATCIHYNPGFTDESFRDYVNCYFLWSGNDGYYPIGKDGFTKYAEKVGFKKIYQQDMTLDYLITTVLFMSYLRCNNKKCSNLMSYSDLIKSLIKTIAGPYYLHTYLCYTPTKDFDNLPWQWEFIPQLKKGKWVTPVTLEYILLQL